MATLEYLFFPSNAGFRFSCNCLEYKVATENFSSHKLALMQIALYLLQAVCYCLHLVIRLWFKSSTLEQNMSLERTEHEIEIWLINFKQSVTSMLIFKAKYI